MNGLKNTRVRVRVISSHKRNTWTDRNNMHHRIPWLRTVINFQNCQTSLNLANPTQPFFRIQFCFLEKYLFGYDNNTVLSPPLSALLPV